MTKTLFIGLIISWAILSGCSNTPQASVRLCLDEQGELNPCPENKLAKVKLQRKPETPERFSPENPQQRYMPLAGTNKRLAHYIEQLAMQLVRNEHKSQLNGDIAIATFVKFDNGLRTGSVLGNQIAELFYHELQQFGYEVVDLKNHDYIDSTAQGDFNFSRKAQRFSAGAQFKHVLSGTLIYKERGVLVNTRIINVDNQRVMASASGFIPNFVMN